MNNHIKGKNIKTMLILISSLISNSALAWSLGENVKISSIMLWENSGANPLYFKRSDNVWCYVPANENSLQSLILTLYASGRKAEIHCHDNAENKMGGVQPAHKLHRIIAN